MFCGHFLTARPSVILCFLQENLAVEAFTGLKRDCGKLCHLAWLVTGSGCSSLFFYPSLNLIAISQGVIARR